MSTNDPLCYECSQWLEGGYCYNCNSIRVPFHDIAYENWGQSHYLVHPGVEYESASPKVSRQEPTPTEDRGEAETQEAVQDELQRPSKEEKMADVKICRKCGSSFLAFPGEVECDRCEFYGG